MKDPKNLIINIVTSVLIGLMVILIAVKSIFVEVVVNGPSMNPTLTHMEYGYTDRFLFKIFGLDRYDIVVIETKDDSLFIKRVIGLPYETIQIKEGRVYINDKLLEDDIYCEDLIIDAGIANEKISLGKNEYFVMGDNRNNSLDSRSSYLGVVNFDDIYGHSFISRGFCSDLVCNEVYDKHSYDVKGW